MTKGIVSIQSQAKAHPKTMAKQELEKQQELEKNDTKERPDKKEVIITVYVESPSSPSHSHQKPGRFKTIKPASNSRRPHQTAKTRSYDRRAHLLAYSQELRTTGDSQRVQWPKNGSKPKLRVGSKKLTTPVRPRRTKSRWRYQRLVPEVDISCDGWKKKKATGSETNSNFLRKLRFVLRGISCGWRCNKGSKVAEKNYAV